MTILLIEEDAALTRGVVSHFRDSGRAIDAVHDGESGLSVAARCNYEVIVIACDLPGISGLEVLRGLRAEECSVPVLMLGCAGEAVDRCAAGSTGQGIDEYLPNPVDAAALVDRVNAMLARISASERLQAGAVALNLHDESATRAGKAISLSPLEFRLLKYLAVNLDQLVSRRMLLENVWKISFDPHTSLIESHMSRLRSKVNKGFETDVIQTVRNRGYKLVSRP